MEDPARDPREGGTSGGHLDPGDGSPSGSRVLQGIASRCRRNPTTWWLYRVVLGVAADQSIYRTSLSAAGVAFWLLIAIFPAGMAVVSVFGLVVDPNEIATMLGGGDPSGSGSLMIALRAQLQQFAEADTGTLSLSLAVSVIVFLWSASVLAYGASRAIRMIYGLPPVGYVRLRLQCLAAAGIIVVIVGVAAMAFDGLGRLGQGLGEPARDIFLLALVLPLRMVALAAVLVAMVRFSVGRVALARGLWPGAVGSAILILAAFLGFGPYVAAFGDQYQVYGAAAGAVIAMLLAWIACYLALLGVIANTVMDGMRHAQDDAGTIGDRSRLRALQRQRYLEKSAAGRSADDRAGSTSTASRR